MPTFSLFEKIPAHNRQQNLYALRQFVEGSVEALQTDIKIGEPDTDGRVTLEATGEDTEVLKHFLSKNFGLVPKSIRRGKILRSYVTRIDESKQELNLEVGVPQSSIVLPGLLLRKTFTRDSAPLASIVSAFCLRPNYPLEISMRETKKGKTTAVLSRTQRTLFVKWSTDLLDRVVILGTTRRNVKNSLAKTGNLRNVTDTERLSFFSQSVPVKLGLDSLRIKKTLENELAPADVSLFEAQKAWKLLNQPA